MKGSHDSFIKQDDPKEGDLVMIKYKDSKYFRQIGKIYYIREDGDCSVDILYGGFAMFYKTHLIKIVQIVETPGGEVFCIPYIDCIHLAASNLLEYDFDKRIYTFRSDDIWQIEDYIL